MLVDMGDLFSHIGLREQVYGGLIGLYKQRLDNIPLVYRIKTQNYKHRLISLSSKYVSVYVIARVKISDFGARIALNSRVYVPGHVNLVSFISTCPLCLSSEQQCQKVLIAWATRNKTRDLLDWE